MSRTLKLFLPLLLLIVLGSCSDAPEGVLSRKEMASLLADIHRGEAVVDMQRTVYQTDSMRKLLKQSIYERHGVTAEQVDSSLMWYGHNIEEYLEVYDDVIALLEKDANISGTKRPFFAEGDSVDIWMGERSYRVTSGQTLHNITFVCDPSADIQAGDNFTLQYKLVNIPKNFHGTNGHLFAKYDDGVIESRQGGIAPDGWTKVRLVTDSAQTSVPRIYGFLSFDPAESAVMIIDSISLIRTRNIPANYRQRNGQRRIETVPAKPMPVGDNDTKK